ncbi:MAG TPA: GAF domain-containing sensor histidine kinase [Ktedonobacteraceae bacterium]|nr:GAF domain-containing sensor histidine kinase [Ktedonobacteraceae bacterium]
MSQTAKKLQAIPQTTLRRLRNTPSYFFLLWRWSAWLYALIWLVSINGQPYGTDIRGEQFPLLATALLAVTFIQTLVVTLYAPVFHIFLPSLPGLKKVRQPGQQVRAKQWNIRRRRRSQAPTTDEETDILTPLARTRNSYWDIAIYGSDLLICSLVTYLGGYFGSPHFGTFSPFYRYGISTALAAALTYRYRGGLLVALGYDLLIILGAFFQPPGIPPSPLTMGYLVGSLLDTPVIAILAAYLASLLESYTRSKRREQHNARQQQALRKVGETLVAGGSDRKRLLQESVEQIRKGGHFERLVVALLENGQQGTYMTFDSHLETSFAESPLPDKSASVFERVIRSGEKLLSFEPVVGEGGDDGYGIAYLYLPIFREGQLYMILGAESTRQTPFEKQQEDFLRTTGAQLVVALENIRLTEQTVELAAVAERGRLAREIHDGVAQLVYMLSLNTETCAALAHRMAEASDEEDKEALIPLAERLDKLVTISKQALWETRHYMFTLKPLISGTTTLTQMLTNQLHEFEAISGLPVRLEVEGNEEEVQGNQRQTQKMAQMGTAIFRITQEALTNAYKHADATQLNVHLRYLPERVEVEICDNGKGLNITQHQYDLSATGERRRIYSGHGMGGMRERAEELGGTFEIKQLSSGGVSVRASLPR